MPKNSALFVGRFQPFHNGHLDVIKQILKKNDRVIIAIGSAEKNFLPDKPLTAGERFELIDESLRAEKIPAEKYCIIPVRNVNNYAIWVDHLNIYIPPYNRVYTGSHIVKACYETKKNPPKIMGLERNMKISATEVRNKILNKEKWEHLVPKAVSTLLKKWKIERRIEDVQDTMDFTRYNNEY